MAGLIVKAETADGSIDHALQLAVDYALTKPGFTGEAISGDGGNANGLVQEGQRLAISPNTPMRSGLSALGQEVFVALQKYGAFVVDVAGGTTALRVQENDFDEATIAALQRDVGKLVPLLGQVTINSSPPPTNPPADQTSPTIGGVVASPGASSFAATSATANLRTAAAVF